MKLSDAGRLLRALAKRSARPAREDGAVAAVDGAPAVTDADAARTRGAPTVRIASPTVLPLSTWGVLAAGTALLIGLGWTTVSALGLRDAANAASAVMLRSPSLDEHPEAGRYPGVPLRASAASIADGDDPQARLAEALALIGQFENGRSEFRLREVRAVVAGVAPESPAARAGVMPGDEIVSVNGRPAGYVWDLLHELTATPDGRAVLEVRRGGATVTLAIRSVTDAPLDSVNTGLLFPLAEDVNHLGPTDRLRLQRALTTGYLAAVPRAWHAQYAASLEALGRGLVERLTELAQDGAARSAPLRVPALLEWHHQAFLDALARTERAAAAARVRQLASLARLAEALAATALAAAALLAALAWERRDRPPRSRRSG